MFGVMKPTKQPVTRLDYCQYLLSSQIIHTLTRFADHTEAFRHDMLNRYLLGDRITPGVVWENVKEQVVQCAHGRRSEARHMTQQFQVWLYGRRIVPSKPLAEDQ